MLEDENSDMSRIVLATFFRQPPKGEPHEWASYLAQDLAFLGQYQAEAFLRRTQVEGEERPLAITHLDLYAGDLVFGLAEMPGKAAVMWGFTACWHPKTNWII